MVIAGWRKNFELLADAGQRPCSNCLHTTRHYLVGERQEVRLYFVPVAKFGRKRHLVCEVCNHTAPVSDTEASRIMHGIFKSIPSHTTDPSPQETPSLQQVGRQPVGGADGSLDGFRFLLGTATNDESLEEELTQKYAADGLLLFETVAAAAGQMAQGLVGEESGPEAMATQLRHFAESIDEAKGAVEYVIAIHAGDTDRAEELLATTTVATVVTLAIAINAALAETLEVTPVDVLNWYLERTPPSSSAIRQVGELEEMGIGSGGLPIIHACDVSGCSYRSYTAEGLDMHFDYVHGAPLEDEASAMPENLEEPPEPASMEFKTCPDCAEEVRAAARKCRFCNYRFVPESMSSDIGPGLRR
jgi:hypothetical protein